ncbi:MAG TPA: hypothetical protein DCE56_36645 [Cyanobacteria bacterium UBA8553]|nr:hypothetical protein [Cyanobacteria bacterium UBA8553]HAJ57924.1 hypothetical protein [Cyanobacteria bacterium UBA8543]
MHQLDSDCRKSFDSALPEAKVVERALHQKTPDYVSDRKIIEKLEALALSVSISKNQILASKELEVANGVSAVENSPNNCTVDAKENAEESSSDRQLEQFISNLLKYGVFLASTVVLLGGILYLIRYGTQPANYQFFQVKSSLSSSPSDLIADILSGKCQSIIQLGLLILVATPIARVAFSVLAFLRQRDFTYVMLTLLVLSGLIYSLVGAYV